MLTSPKHRPQPTPKKEPPIIIRNVKHANLRQAVKTSDRAKIEEFIANGETIPNRALAWSNDIGTTKLLIAHGADPQKVDRDRQNALFGCQSVEIAKLLIEHGADPKTIDNGGRNALFECKYFSIAKLLIEHGANPNLVDHNGDKCRWADYTFA